MIKGTPLSSRDRNVEIFDISPITIIDFKELPRNDNFKYGYGTCQFASADNPNQENVWLKIEFSFGGKESPPIITNGNEWLGCRPTYGYGEEYRIFSCGPGNNWIVPSKRQIAEAIDD